MKLKLPPTPESRSIVAEQKSLDSREKVAETKVAQYDPDSLLNISNKVIEIAPVVVEAPIQNDPHKKQSRSEYHKTWAKDKAQISFRITTD